MTEQRDNATDQAFAEAFRQNRVTSNLSQSDVAAQMSVRGFDFHQSTVGKIERGERRVTVGEAVALAEIVRSRIEILAESDTNSPRTRRRYLEQVAVSYMTNLLGLEEAVDRLPELRRELLAAIDSFDAKLEPGEQWDPSTTRAAEFFAALVNLEPVKVDLAPAEALIELYGLRDSWTKWRL